MQRISTPSVSPVGVFGIKSNLKHPLQWIDENSFIYVAGNNVVLSDKSQQSLKFLPLTDRGDSVQSVSISSDKKYLAVSESSSRLLPFICIYDVASMRKLKSISPALVGTNSAVSFTHVSFSENSKLIASVLGAPHNTLQLVNWEKGQICAVVDCINPEPSTDGAEAVAKASIPARVEQQLTLARSSSQPEIVDMSINPYDSYQIVIIANCFVKVYNYVNGVLECHVVDVQGVNGTFTSHLWLAHDRFLVGTSRGELHCVSRKMASAFTAELVAHSKLDSNGLEAGNSHIGSGDAVKGSITCISKTPKGFFVSHTSGLVVYYTVSTDSLEGKTLLDGDSTPTRLLETKPVIAERGNLKLPAANNFALYLIPSPSMESCLVLLNTNQTLAFSLGCYESDPQANDAIKLLPVTLPFHYGGGVLDMDDACRKAYLATLGRDHTVRIWNYVTNTLELFTAFSEQVMSLSIHPSGLYLLVGFADKARVYSITVDDLRIAKEINLRSCRKLPMAKVMAKELKGAEILLFPLCKYSNGGQYFAAVNGNLISVYCSWTFEVKCTLKAHNNKIKSLYWSPDDQRLVSCGADGGVYLWNIPSGTRESEFVLKTCSFESAITSFDGKTIWAIGSDNMIREIFESSVTRELLLDFVPTQISLARTGEMLFCGTRDGNLKSIQLPLTKVAHDYQTHMAHSMQINRICFSFDNRYVFTCGEDGVIYQFHRNDAGVVGSRKEQVSLYSDEILMTKVDQGDRLAQINDLERQLQEMKLGEEYQFRLKDMTFAEQMKEITESYSKEIEILKREPAQLRREKDTEELAHLEQFKALKTKYMDERQDMESKYSMELMAEFEKYHRKQLQVTTELESYAKRYADLDRDQAKSLNQISTKQNQQLQQLESQIAQLREQVRVQYRDHSEMRRQLEEDIDAEIKLIEAQCIQKIQLEHDELARLKGESGIMRKKFTTLSKDIDDSKTEFLQLGENCEKLQKDVKNLENTVSVLKEKISEYDELIQQKERKIYELKKNNQEMEKYKFVLDYRIKDLKHQIEPRETSIAEISAAMEHLSGELEGASRTKDQLLQQSQEQERILAENKQLYTKEHQRLRRIIGLIIKMKKDVADSVAFIQDPPKLQLAVNKLLEDYCQNMEEAEISANPESLDEIKRQHRQLSQTISKLKKQQLELAAQHQADKLLGMTENEKLLAECKNIRLELKFNSNASGNLLKATKVNALVQARMGKHIQTRGS